MKDFYSSTISSLEKEVQVPNDENHIDYGIYYGQQEKRGGIRYVAGE